MAHLQTLLSSVPQIFPPNSQPALLPLKEILVHPMLSAMFRPLEHYSAHVGSQERLVRGLNVIIKEQVCMLQV